MTRRPAHATRNRHAGRPQALHLPSPPVSFGREDAPGRNRGVLCGLKPEKQQGKIAMKKTLAWRGRHWIAILALALPLTASGQTCAKLQADKDQLHGEYQQLEREMLTHQSQMKKMTIALNDGILSATGYATWGEAKTAAYRQVLQWQKLESRRLALEERANKLEMAFYRAGCPW